MSAQDNSSFEPGTQLSLDHDDIQYQPLNILSSLIEPKEHSTESSEGSSTICRLSDSGLECRVCGVNDGKTTSSTWGVMLCMLILLGMAAFQKRRSKDSTWTASSSCIEKGIESDLGDDEKAVS